MQAHTAAATWNIIRHYSGMSEETIQNMERLVDDLSNGMMLHSDVHTVFDKLKVYLERTEVSLQAFVLAAPILISATARKRVCRQGGRRQAMDTPSRAPR